MRTQLSYRGLGFEATSALRDLILDGHFQPGAHIVESDLAERLGVSPGTVRVALQELRHEGLLEHRPNRGVFVKQLDVEDAWEVYTLRGTLEAMGARLAAKRINDEGRQDLQAVFDEMVEAVQRGDRSRAVSYGSEFHSCIVRLSGHKLLNEHYQLLESKTRLIMFLTENSHEDSRYIISRHKPMLDAILEGNPEKAEKLVIEHNVITIKNLIEYINNVDTEHKLKSFDSEI